MKNILLVGANSSSAKKLYDVYNHQYNFIRLSRNVEVSDVDNFDILNSETYYSNNIKLDGLVYFPGTINLKPFKSLEAEDFIRDFEINIIGLVKILKFYYSCFNTGSSMVFISSLASKIGMPFHSTVSASKSAIVGLCSSLAAEFAPQFRVNCISPSMVRSTMSTRFLRNEKSEERIKGNNPLKMIGEPDDIASLINFLLSNQSRWITAQNISIDGGMCNLKV